MLMFLTWLTLMDVGLLHDPSQPKTPPTATPTSPGRALPIRHALEDWPEHR